MAASSKREQQQQFALHEKRLGLPPAPCRGHPVRFLIRATSSTWHNDHGGGGRRPLQTRTHGLSVVPGTSTTAYTLIHNLLLQRSAGPNPASSAYGSTAGRWINSGPFYTLREREVLNDLSSWTAISTRKRTPPPTRASPSLNTALAAGSYSELPLRPPPVARRIHSQAAGSRWQQPRHGHSRWPRRIPVGRLALRRYRDLTEVGSGSGRAGRTPAERWDSAGTVLSAPSPASVLFGTPLHPRFKKQLVRFTSVTFTVPSVQWRPLLPSRSRNSGRYGTPNNDPGSTVLTAKLIR